MTEDSFIRQAFEKVCTEAKPIEGACVVLWETTSFYGGPEEGGWWGHDVIPVAYQRFATKEAAEAAANEVRKLAAELTKQANREFGDACLREMDWLEARGLDADYLPEPDGPSEFNVDITEGTPEPSYGCRHYE